MEIGWENLYLDLGAQRVNEIQAEIQMEISIFSSLVYFLLNLWETL